MKMFRWAALTAAALTLQSCFFAPGKFDSTLDLRRDGRFTYSYTGEILFFEGENRNRSAAADLCYGPPPPAASRNNLVQDAPPPPAVVRTAPPAPPADAEGQRPVEGSEGKSRDVDVDFAGRPCTPAEKAQRAAHRANQAKQEAAMMSAVIGFDPNDSRSVASYIAELKRYPGWRSITHKGGNRFEIDYRLSGTATQDFLFPVFDKVVVHTPFVTLRPRSDGSAEVRAPGLGGGSLNAFMALAGGPMGAASQAGNDDNPFASLMKATDGTFTLITDGEIRTNNTAEGPTARGPDKVLSWRLTGATREAPRALVQLR